MKNKQKIDEKSENLNTFTPETLSELQKKLDIKIKKFEIYEQAFTHTSFPVPNKDTACNERLEFLGDAVLELAVSKYLFETYPLKREGELTKIRSQLVNKKTLADISVTLNLQKYLKLAYGAEKERTNPAILADLLEAFIAAIYIDSGITAAEKFIKKHIIHPSLKKGKEGTISIHYKNQLQEILQSKTKQLPEYKTLEEVGFAHDKTFTVGIFIGTEQISVGTGKSKKIAEQNAAALALEKITQLHISL